MSAQASQLFAAWQPSKQNYVEGEQPNPAALGEGGVEAEGGAIGPEGAVGPSGPLLAKAGTIMFAVLDTAVNSDEPGPVLATIVTGRYKGAKLLGSLTTFPPSGKKVMLTFNIMTLHRVEQSVQINAVAIDPDTARTALSSYTNNHYCLRFGSLFAASFLEGYGQAFLQSGQSVISTASSTTTVSPSLSPGGKLMVALGNVGNQFGTVLQNVYNMPPTVQVYSGTGVGILFLSDVRLPT